nr:Fc receptor-like protein 5 [Danio rerio]|eukprot:XP_021327041.1 Fc receptor-like protein 5 [Danio rerio]
MLQDKDYQKIFCNSQVSMKLSQLPLVLLLISNIHSEHVEDYPKASVRITPDLHVFRGESVTLRCDINAEGVSSWLYSWYKEGSEGAFSGLQEYIFNVTESYAGKYSCSGTESKGSRRSQMSDAVALTVSDRAQTALSVSPQNWLTEGDSVTLTCEVNGSSTGWTFNWYMLMLSDNSYHHKLLSDSSRGAGGKYTVSSVALKQTGVYLCEIERGKPAYTTFSNTLPLWVTASVSPPVSLVISPSRAQHFTSDSLSLSCEDKSNSAGWRVRRYTESWWMSNCSSQTGSTCTVSLTTSDTGVYWCQSESGEKYNPVNITVQSGVILESPVHPVTEGDPLTLHCLYKSTTRAKLRADFYKDGSLVQNQTSEMIITAVSKSHEGFYYCKHPEGESQKSWISVRASRSDGVDPVIIGVIAGLAVIVLIFIFLVLLCCYRNKKGVRSPSPSRVSQTSQQKQNEAGHQTLLSETAHTDTTHEDICKTDSESGAELTYAEVELKSTKKMKGNTDKGNNTENSGCVYSKLKLKTHQSAGSSDGTYAQVK